MILNFLFLLLISTKFSQVEAYTPYKVSCPSVNIVRKGSDELSQAEQSWLSKRQNKSKNNLKDFLRYTAKLTDEDYDYLNLDVDDNTINIGLSFSGGGYRAMLIGAGVLSSMDNRTTYAFDSGLGGLLQSSTYIVGSSGGNWLVGSLASNGYPSVDQIIHEKDLWDFTMPVYSTGGMDIAETYSTWKDVVIDVWKKKQAGFQVTLSDIWARIITIDLLPSNTDHGENITWSDLKHVSSIENADMPLPISVADLRNGEELIFVNNSTVFESTPFEFGSWDKTLNEFINIEYLGSKLDHGNPENESQCINGFDNVGFIMGASLSIFDQVIDIIKKNSVGYQDTYLYQLITYYLGDLVNVNNIEASIQPNPFYDSSVDNLTSYKSTKHLYLCDGGTDGQNVPLEPLLQPSRNMDFVFVSDSSRNKDGYPNGDSLRQTYKRQFNPSVDWSFPDFPSEQEFEENDFNSKPFFIGCDSSKFSSSEKPSIPPLIVYASNREYSIASNISTEESSFSDAYRDQIIENGFQIGTRNYKQDDLDWAHCVGCAIVRRQQERIGAEQSESCKKCFQKYCWEK